ncbi:hypothetical protein FQZ97_891760 [compost metagenome]
MAVVAAVVELGADAVTRRPLGGNTREVVPAVFVLGRQVVDVGAVLAEALGHAQVGLEQGGVEHPVQGFDIGVPPGAFVAAYPLPAKAQVLAGVGGEAAVVHPELAQCQVALVGFAGVIVTLAVGHYAVRLQGIGLDHVGGRYALPHGVGAPVAPLAVEPGTHIQADALDIATGAGAQVAVVLGLAGDLDVQADVAWLLQGCRRNLATEQRTTQNAPHPARHFHSRSTPFCSG